MIHYLRQYGVFTFAALMCFTPWVNSPIALTIGFLLVSFGFVPHTIPLTKIIKKLLAYSIVGLGFGINIQQAVSATENGFGIIVTTIFSTLIIGTLLAKRMGLERETGHLIASGTAICGGSAIAAVAPAINAKDQPVAMSLAVIYVLNSVALFLFPVIGHALGLSQSQFGTWAAIAIHDTSSVVGAAQAYGEQSLQIATTLKLARALWIVPVAFISALLFKNDSKKITIPFFILFYIGAIVFSDQVPQFSAVYHAIYTFAKQTLVLCLFLIGCGISIQKLKATGPKPMIFGVILWVVISVSSLTWILTHIQ
ncbi:putative sulfate exporter family transporter [Vibrio sp. S11_S32]|uniref:YeiH family protein n=1 Tax=Vibrio sp. S11_S32 TaxID=2720225 RepID=UPI0016811449|nr:putative sulfate exporter family transporter [Vibrio sp. S11_S32]MBD1575505.1 putative sulfate exporter family transporter [Vibrio sp. S11_S32]